MVLYIRGNTGTGFNARKNGAQGLWREQSKCREHALSEHGFTDVRVLELDGNHGYRRL